MNTTKNNLHTQMYAHYRNWEASGQSQIGYCNTSGLAFAKFNYWVRKFRTSSLPVSHGSSGFVAVELAPSCTPVLEISHKSGHRISFYRTVEACFIKELLS